MATILITGANRGIGLALAKQFTANGHQVIATARKPSAAVELISTGADVKQLDVSDPDSISALKAEIGETPIDYLINNAGIAESSDFGNLNYENFAHVLAVNALSPLRMIETFTDNVAASDRKIIGNLSSQLGSIQNADGPFALIYRTSKAALNMALRSAAPKLAEKDITVLALHPGWVQTDMGGKNAVVTPEESAAGLYQVMTSAQPAAELRFLDYQGKTLPW